MIKITFKLFIFFIFFWHFIKIDEDLINLKKENEALWIEIARLIYTWKNGEYCLKEIKPPKENKEHIENG